MNKHHKSVLDYMANPPSFVPPDGMVIIDDVGGPKTKAERDAFMAWARENFARYRRSENDAA
jgi:hypothetical protein